MASLSTNKQKPNKQSGSPTLFAKQNHSPKTQGQTSSSSKGTKPKSGKKPASQAQCVPYDLAWRGHEALHCLELDSRSGPPNHKRDALARTLPGNACLFLSMLALATDQVTVSWLESIVAKGKEQYPVPHKRAYELMSCFCVKEGTKLNLMRADARPTGEMAIMQRKVFGEHQPRERWLIEIPTVMQTDHGVELGCHLLPVRKLNKQGAGLDASALFGEDGAPGQEESKPTAPGSPTSVQSPCTTQKPGEKSTPGPGSTGIVQPPCAVQTQPPLPLKLLQTQLMAESWEEWEGQPEKPGADSVKNESGVVARPPQEPTRLEICEAFQDLQRFTVRDTFWKAGLGVRRERAWNHKAKEDTMVGLPELFGESAVPSESPRYDGQEMCPGDFPKLSKEPVYEGEWDPGFPVAWRGGWFAQCKPENPRRLAGWFGAPTIAAASLAQASKWIDRCMYVPYIEGSHVVHGSGTVKSGVQQTEKFEEGEVLNLSGKRYLVRSVWYGVDIGGNFLAKRLFSLDLAQDGLFAMTSENKDIAKSLLAGAVAAGAAWALSKVTERTPCPAVSALLAVGTTFVESRHLVRLTAVSSTQDKVERSVPKVPTGQLETKLGYSLLLERAPDHCQPMAVVARTDAAMRGWAEPAMQPHLAERYIASKQSEGAGKDWGYGGGSGYNWGYCFSCGANPPGQFPGRLCAKGACLNCTKAARMATYGYQVVRPGGIVYPGVIQNVGQFPPLKASVRTMATAETLKGVPLDKDALRALPMEQQPAARLGGIGFGGAYPFSFARGPGVLGAALAYRAFRDVEINVHPRVFQHIAQYCWLLIPGFAVPKDHLPWTREFWINSMPMRRRKPLQNALRKRLQRGEPHKHYSKFKPFVKDEHALWAGVIDGELSNEVVEAIPRTIFAPHDETHLDAGRYLKPLVQELKGVWHPENWIFYASSTPEKLDAWLNASCNAESYFCADYSAFERSHSPKSWDFMEGLYRQIYPGAEPEFWKALKAWREPSGVTKMPKFDARIEFKAQCMNASGRDDTSLSNAILNGMALAFSFAAALSGKTVLEVGVEELRRAQELVRIAVMGDDSLVACSFDVAKYQEKILESLRLFGFVVKSFATPNLHDVTFLGMMPYPVAGRFYWGPTIGRRMYKAFWQHDAKGNLPAWTKGAAQQLMLCACVPIVYDCAVQVDTVLAGKKATKLERVMEGYGSAWTCRTTATPHYDDSTLEWVSRRYPGLTVKAIRVDIARIRCVERLPALIRLRTTDLAFTLDEM